MAYSAVIFDLFGTLVNDFVSSAGQVHTKMAAALGVPHQDFLRLWNRTLEMRIIGAFQTVEASLHYVLDALNVRVRAEQVEKAVEIRMKSIAQALEPRSDAIETMVQLKKRPMKLGLISNCSIEIPVLWQQTAFAHWIDTPIFSSVARLKKPDPRIFDLACERLGMPAGSCLYVADGEDYELSAAAKAGLHPVLIKAPSRQSHNERCQEANEWHGDAIVSLLEVPTFLGSTSHP
jgi:putative hydrolase of the HAD superfamily